MALAASISEIYEQLSSLVRVIVHDFFSPLSTLSGNSYRALACLFRKTVPCIIAKSLSLFLVRSVFLDPDLRRTCCLLCKSEMIFGKAGDKLKPRVMQIFSEC